MNDNKMNWGYVPLPFVNEAYELLKTTITSILKLRQERNVNGEVVTLIRTNGEKILNEWNLSFLKAKCKISELIFEELPDDIDNPSPPLNEGFILSPVFQIAVEGIPPLFYVQTGIKIPVANKSLEAEKIEQDIKKTKKILDGLKKQLDNEGFIHRAPKEVVNQKQSEHDALMGKLIELENRKKQFE